MKRLLLALFLLPLLVAAQDVTIFTVEKPYTIEYSQQADIQIYTNGYTKIDGKVIKDDYFAGYKAWLVWGKQVLRVIPGSSLDLVKGYENAMQVLPVVEQGAITWPNVRTRYPNTILAYDRDGLIYVLESRLPVRDAAMWLVEHYDIEYAILANQWNIAKAGLNIKEL